VVARTLGIPNDVVDATEHLLGLADRFEPRRIDLGIANGRRFVFSCGCGLDASAAMRVDRKPKMKARAGPYFYTAVAVSSFYREYLRNPVLMRLEVGDQSVEGVTVLSQNSDPFTYFGNRPVRVCEGVAIDDGTLSVAILRRAAQRDMGPIIARVLAEGLRASRHRQIAHFDDVAAARVVSASTDAAGNARAFPIQVDGDYVGAHAELDLAVDPGALTVVA
jgi:diacylglycerol kinase family enzyme